MSAYLNYSSPDPTPLRTVAHSVAEAALESGPNSPSINMCMSDLMDAAPLLDDAWVETADIGTWPRLKTKRSESLAERGQPLWEAVVSAQERREREFGSPIIAAPTPRTPRTPGRNPSPRAWTLAHTPMHARLTAAINSDGRSTYDQDVSLTTRSAEQSPVDSAFSVMLPLADALPRLSAQDFAIQAQEKAAIAAHARTRSDVNRSPSSVLRSQQQPRFRPRLPSLAQIQAKMHGSGSSPVYTNHRGQFRSDSVDSVDSEGPQTPTEEFSSFDIKAYLGSSSRPMTPDSPSLESRLAPFLRERTNGRLSRPRSCDDSFADDDFTRTPLAPSRAHNQATIKARQSTPHTPVKALFDRDRVTFVVTPPKSKDYPDQPTSPTESVQSTASSTPSLPIITCTPAVEPDSDEESEGDVIVFNGEVELDSDDEDEVERREREKRGMEMRSRLLRRSSEVL
ncbi:hypothetical protein Q8F55_005000 [Vanrija albida]|uniref:Uncharacterized protein n=1 Tax=Vanrija albida TaxID=181172 RepID=A0ABR3Q0E2_9TREE